MDLSSSKLCRNQKSRKKTFYTLWWKINRICKHRVAKLSLFVKGSADNQSTKYACIATNHQTGLSLRFELHHPSNTPC